MYGIFFKVSASNKQYFPKKLGQGMFTSVLNLV